VKKHVVLLVVLLPVFSRGFATAEFSSICQEHTHCLPEKQGLKD
jgi:hypothetical protein